MLVLLLSCLFFQEETHFVDGVEILLKNGTLIKTSAEVKEDLFFMTWREEGHFVSISKEDIRRVDYFSLLVPGPAPKDLSGTVTMRRIKGTPVHYDRNGETHFRFVHVDKRGRSTEGRVNLNRLADMKILGSDMESGVRLGLDFQSVTEGSRVAVRFYNMRGKLLHTSEIEVDKVDRSKKEKKKGMMSCEIVVFDSIDLENIGLIEVLSEAGQ